MFGKENIYIIYKQDIKIQKQKKEKSASALIFISIVIFIIIIPVTLYVLFKTVNAYPNKLSVLNKTINALTIKNMKLWGDNINQITIGYEKITQKYISEYGQESLLVLALLSRHYTIRHEIVFNFKYLFDNLSIKPNRKEQKNKIIQCVGNMFNTDIDFNININQIIALPYEISKDQYLIITDEEVDKILSYDKRVDKFSLFNTYVTIKRYVNYYTGTAYPSIKTIMDITNTISNNTILKYIKILEELKLIDCERSDFIVNDDGVRKANNTYTILA